jgi:hypothetical protein
VTILNDAETYNGRVDIRVPGSMPDASLARRAQLALIVNRVDGVGEGDRQELIEAILTGHMADVVESLLKHLSAEASRPTSAHEFESRGDGSPYCSYCNLPLRNGRHI